MAKGRVYYLHTISGLPAYYTGEQICYAQHYGQAAILCSSLEQIRHEQRASYAWRVKKGYEGRGYREVAKEQGYRRVMVRSSTRRGS